MAVKWFRIWWRANGLATKIDRIFLLTWTCFLLFSNASDASISGFPIFACISVHMPHDLTKPKTVLTWNFIDLCEFHLLPYWRTLGINKNNNIENLTVMTVLYFVWLCIIGSRRSFQPAITLRDRQNERLNLQQPTQVTPNKRAWIALAIDYNCCRFPGYHITMEVFLSYHGWLMGGSGEALEHGETSLCWTA